MSKLHGILGLNWGEWSAIASIASAVIGFIIGLLAKVLGRLNAMDKRNSDVEERNYQMSERQIEMNQRIIDSNDRVNETITKQHNEFMNRIVQQDNRIDRVVDEIGDHETRITRLEKLKKAGI